MLSRCEKCMHRKNALTALIINTPKSANVIQKKKCLRSFRTYMKERFIKWTYQKYQKYWSYMKNG